MFHVLSNYFHEKKNGFNLNAYFFPLSCLRWWKTLMTSRIRRGASSILEAKLMQAIATIWKIQLEAKPKVGRKILPQKTELMCGENKNEINIKTLLCTDVYFEKNMNPVSTPYYCTETPDDASAVIMCWLLINYLYLIWPCVLFHTNKMPSLCLEVV